MDRRLMLKENFSPWGVVCPCPGAIYMYMTIIFKHIFFSEIAKPIKAKLHVEHPWEVGMKVYLNGQGHMTNVAAMAINSRNV